jgi:hypothetical protein
VLDLLLRLVHLRSFLKFLKEAPVIACESLLFFTSSVSHRTKWAMKDARTITKWDNRIKVLDQFPLFKDIPRDSAWGRSVTRWMNLSDRNGMMNVVHLRV